MDPFVERAASWQRSSKAQWWDTAIRDPPERPSASNVGPKLYSASLQSPSPPPDKIAFPRKGHSKAKLSQLSTSESSEEQESGEGSGKSVSSPSTPQLRSRLSRPKSFCGSLSRKLSFSLTSNSKGEEHQRRVKLALPRIQAHIRGFLVRKRHSEDIKRLRERSQCLLELLHTEQTYLRALQCAVRVYIPALEDSSQGRPAIAPEAIQIIFSNIETILNLSVEMLCRLRQAIVGWGTLQFPSSAFIELKPYFSAYAQYINDFDTTQAMLSHCARSQSFQKVQRCCKTVPNYPRHDDLASLLITPIQRIPRYVLLLERLLALTPDYHPEHHLLVQAVGDVNEMAVMINSRKRESLLQVRESPESIGLL
jgi:hypothetical protein